MKTRNRTVISAAGVLALCSMIGVASAQRQQAPLIGTPYHEPAAADPGIEAMLEQGLWAYQQKDRQAAVDSVQQARTQLRQLSGQGLDQRSQRALSTADRRLHQLAYLVAANQLQGPEHYREISQRVTSNLAQLPPFQQGAQRLQSMSPAHFQQLRQWLYGTYQAWGQGDVQTAMEGLRAIHVDLQELEPHLQGRPRQAVAQAAAGVRQLAQQVHRGELRNQREYGEQAQQILRTLNAAVETQRQQRR